MDIMENMQTEVMDMDISERLQELRKQKAIHRSKLPRC